MKSLQQTKANGIYTRALHYSTTTTIYTNDFLNYEHNFETPGLERGTSIDDLQVKQRQKISIFAADTV